MTKIYLKSVNDAALFTDVCNEYMEDINIHIGTIMRDAKSLKSNIDLIGNQNVLVTFVTDDTTVRNRFLNDIKLWIVKEDK